MFLKLPFQPKNPRHLCCVLFQMQKESPEIRESHKYLKKVKDYSSFAIFESAYGLFWVKKTGEYSPKFFQKGEKSIWSDEDIPQSTLNEWTW